MQVSKNRKGVKNAKQLENAVWKATNKGVTYQKGYIRNMCEILPKNSCKNSLTMLNCIIFLNESFFFEN